MNINYLISFLIIPGAILFGLGLGWFFTTTMEYFRNRKKSKMNSEQELEKMYNLRNHFEELQFKNTRMHDRVLSELNSEIRMLENTIFTDLGKIVYEQKRAK